MVEDQRSAPEKVFQYQRIAVKGTGLEGQAARHE